MEIDGLHHEAAIVAHLGQHVMATIIAVGDTTEEAIAT
jgi:hypothetical protein